MYYTKPHTFTSDEYLDKYHQTLEINDRDGVHRFSDWLESIHKWVEGTPKEFTREINFIYSRDNDWMALQNQLFISELIWLFDLLPSYGYTYDNNDKYRIIVHIIHEVVKNSREHAQASFFSKLTFEKEEKWLVFKFIIGDDGPGIKQSLIKLFTDETFMEQFIHKYDYHQNILDLIEQKNFDELQKLYITGEGVSTRVGGPGGSFSRTCLIDLKPENQVWKRTIDLIMRDGEFEQTFSNQLGYLSFDEIRKLPYTLIYSWAVFFSQEKKEEKEIE